MGVAPDAGGTALALGVAASLVLVARKNRGGLGVEGWGSVVGRAETEILNKIFFSRTPETSTKRPSAHLELNIFGLQN